MKYQPISIDLINKISAQNVRYELEYNLFIKNITDTCSYSKVAPRVQVQNALGYIKYKNDADLEKLMEFLK